MDSINDISMAPNDWSKHLHTPCDIPDDCGSYHCPYKDTYAGFEDEMCRVCCGLGVDE